MMYTVTITSQGQISIPAPIRRRMGLNRSKRAVVGLVDGKLMVEPVVDLLDLGGVFKSKKKYTREQERRAMEEAVVEDFT